MLAQLDQHSKSFVEHLLRAARIDGQVGTGRALLNALPCVFGAIDDTGDGEPDVDDHGVDDNELFDVLQSWVLRRTTIRPLTNVPMLTPARDVLPSAGQADEREKRRADSRACTLS